MKYLWRSVDSFWNPFSLSTVCSGDPTQTLPWAWQKAPSSGHFARPSRTNYKDELVPWYKGAFYKAESVFLLFANDGLELTKTG